MDRNSGEIAYKMFVTEYFKIDTEICGYIDLSFEDNGLFSKMLLFESIYFELCSVFRTNVFLKGV